MKFYIALLSTLCLSTVVNAQEPCLVILESLNNLDKPETHFAAGYKLSQSDFCLALENPETAELAGSLKELIGYVGGLSEVSFVDLAPHMRKYLKDEGLVKYSADFADRPAVFPREFYEKFLANPAVDLEKLETSYSDLRSQSISEKLSDNALLILAYATRNLESYRFSADVVRTNLRRIIKTYLMSITSARIPSFKDFVDGNDKMFVFYAHYTRNAAVNLSKELGGPEFTSGSGTAYFDLVKEKIQSLSPLSLEDKVRVSKHLLEPELGPWVNKTYRFEWLLASSHDHSKSEKWNNMGKDFLYDLFQNFSLSLGNDSHGKDPLAIMDMDRFISEYSESFTFGNSKNTIFLKDFLWRTLMQIQGVTAVDPVQIRQKIQEEIGGVGSRLRYKLKLIEQAAEKQRPAVLQSHKENQIKDAESFQLKSGGIKVAQIQGDGKNRAARREEAKRLSIATTLPLVIKVPPALDQRDLFSSIKSQELISDRRYFFRGFATVYGHSEVEKENSSIQFVVMRPSALEDLRKKNLDVTPWVKAFLGGPATENSSNGLKRLHGSRTALWEIKLVGSGYRIIVQQEKSENTWTWLALVPHDQVPGYRLRNRL